MTPARAACISARTAGPRLRRSAASGTTARPSRPAAAATDELRAGPAAVATAGSRRSPNTSSGTGCRGTRSRGVGLAIPGPYQRTASSAARPNLPESFVGFDVHTAYQAALLQRAGRAVPLVVGNDGNMGGVAEAQRVRGARDATVLMLAPGSGLGCAYIDRHGLPLDGDTLAGMEAAHMPAPLHLLERPAVPLRLRPDVGLRRGLHDPGGAAVSARRELARHPEHELARSPLAPKERAFALRGLAQHGDPLALEIFDFQARALGLHVASLAMALDPQFVVIGGGLMDPEATTEPFRERYLRIVARDGGAVPLADAARRAQHRPGNARRTVAGDRRCARRALQEPDRSAVAFERSLIRTRRAPAGASKWFQNRHRPAKAGRHQRF